MMTNQRRKIILTELSDLQDELYPDVG